MKVVILFTMQGCPFCGMIKDEFEKNDIDYIERDIEEHREEYTAFSEATENDFLPAFMLMTFTDKDEVHNVKLCAPDRDFEDIFAGVELVKEYLSI